MLDDALSVTQKEMVDCPLLTPVAPPTISQSSTRLLTTMEQAHVTVSHGQYESRSIKKCLFCKKGA
jgi:hypothetical protein